MKVNIRIHVKLSIKQTINIIVERNTKSALELPFEFLYLHSKMHIHYIAVNYGHDRHYSSGYIYIFIYLYLFIYNL